MRCQLVQAHAYKSASLTYSQVTVMDTRPTEILLWCWSFLFQFIYQQSTELSGKSSTGISSQTHTQDIEQNLTVKWNIIISKSINIYYIIYSCYIMHLTVCIHNIYPCVSIQIVWRYVYGLVFILVIALQGIILHCFYIRGTNNVDFTMSHSLHIIHAI